MRRRTKNFLQAEDAQAEMIGFVLILGIVLSVSTMYFASQVPEWTKDNEAQHATDAGDDFSKLKVLIDGIKGEVFEKTTPIKMAPDPVPIFGSSSSSSNFVFKPEGGKFELIVPVGGGSGGSGSWTIPNSSFVSYYDQSNSNRVSVSLNEVTISSPSTTDLILNNAVTELTGDLIYPYIHYYGQVIIANNSVLSVAPATGVLRIYAQQIIVDSSSRLNADGRGYIAGTGTGYGRPASNDDGGGGAGYGGNGGDGGGSTAGKGGGKYGDISSVFEQMGSGGGAGSATSGSAGAGGSGGGGIWLDAEKITFSGTISANGAPGAGGSGGDAGGGGGGSGGGILIRGKEVAISGTLSANGGNGGNGYGLGDGGGGGAGGRIKIFYEVGTVNPAILRNEGQGGSGTPAGSKGESGSYYVTQAAYITSPGGGTYYPSGYFVSTVYDVGNASVCYGEMTWDTTLNSDLVMKIRTDCNNSMAFATPWDKCPTLISQNGVNKVDLLGVSSVSPVAHRYIQFRVDLSTDDETKTPFLHRVKVNYSFPAQNPVLATAYGSINFNSNYLYYPNQEIVYEHGAVIKYQREGGFMLQSPPISLSNKSGIPSIKISMVNLSGTNYSYSGATTISVKSTFKDYNLFADSLRYPNLRINLTTKYPSVWGNWFNTKFEEAGLDHSFYNVTVKAKNVEVNVYGHEQGIELYLEKTEVEVGI